MPDTLQVGTVPAAGFDPERRTKKELSVCRAKVAALKAATNVELHPQLTLRQLEAAVELFETVDPSMLSNQELTYVLVELEVVMRNLETARRRLVAELVKRTITRQTGWTVHRGIASARR